MTLPFSAAESLYRAGRYQEIAVDCRSDVASLAKTTTTEHRALLSEVLLWNGFLDVAKRIALEIERDSASSSAAIARAQYVLATIAKESGVYEEAVVLFQQSIRSAKQLGQFSQAALSSLMWFRLAAERQPREVTRNLLGEIRGLVTRAAEPYLSAFLHESVARHECQSGNADEARRHLRIAMSLLERYPNAWIEQLCEINAFCLAWIECELDDAESHLRRARTLTRITGSLNSIVTNNEGHLHIQRGRLSQAADRLKHVISTADGPTRLGALEGSARLCLVSGDLIECERILQELQNFHTETALSNSFALRWSLITTIRLLLRQHKYHEAIEVADSAISAAKKVGDKQLIGTASMLRAEALTLTGSDEESAVAICQAISVNLWGFREQLGTAMQACVEILEHFGEPLGQRIGERARRIWLDQGNASAEAECRSIKCGSSPAKRPGPLSGRDLAYGVTEAIASVFDVAHSPRLVGAELTELVKILNCSQRAEVTSDGTPTGATDNDGQCVLTLGSQGAKTFNLRCDVPPSSMQAMRLGAIFRIGRAAVTLERFRQEERNRAALWPADPIETEAGALFLAEEMQTLLATARRIALTNVPVLITGETGTGKEVLARLIHAYSSRAKAVFLPFNCTATPKDMLDSQLFGHRRGSFTGAIDNFQGVIRGAANGTLFLDEIGETTLDVQPKLLRFLESGDVHPIGETQPVRVDVRVIAATNADLDTLVSQGRFREDLFYRLNIIPLHVPPLRERRVEIPALAHHYLRKYAQENGKGDLRLGEETMEYLVLYRWPGNVRQLANEMRRMAALAENGAVLMPEHLSAPIAASRRTLPPSDRALDPTEVVVRLDQPMAAGVQHLERAMILYALKQTGGGMEETASRLGLSRKGLYLKRQRFGLLEADETAADVARS